MFTNCAIGTNPTADRDPNSFSGQMGSIYLFGDALTGTHVSALYRLGADYRGNFRDSNDSTAPLSAEERRALFDGSLTSSVRFAYHARACVLRKYAGGSGANETMCVDKSPGELTPFFVGPSPDARLLVGSQAIITHRLYEALECMDGVTALLPLFSQIDHAVVPARTADRSDVADRTSETSVRGPDEAGAAVADPAASASTAIAATVAASTRPADAESRSGPAPEANREPSVISVPADQFSIDEEFSRALMQLISDLVRHSVRVQQQMEQTRGFVVIASVLAQSSVRHMSDRMLQLILDMAEYLRREARDSAQHHPAALALLRDIMEHILFNAPLWIYAPVSVQMSLLSSLATDYVHDCAALDLRSLVGVPRILDMLRYYYWMREDVHARCAEPAVHPRTRAVIALRPSRRDMASLRTFLLLIIKQYMTREALPAARDEVRALMAYLYLSNTVEEHILDALGLLLALSCEPVSRVMVELEQLDAMTMCLSLLDCASQSVQVYAIKLLGQCVNAVSGRRRERGAEDRAVYRVLAQRLLDHHTPLDMPTYNALFELITNTVNTQILTDRHPHPDVSCELHNPEALYVVFALIQQSGCAPPVLLQVISDLVVLLTQSEVSACRKRAVRGVRALTLGLSTRFRLRCRPIGTTCCRLTDGSNGCCCC